MTRLAKMTRRIGIMVAAPAVLAVAAMAAAPHATIHPPRSVLATKSVGSGNSSVGFTEDNKLMRPTGYRKWTYVGTPLTPNDMNDGRAPFPEFHSVYVNPEAFQHYETTGEFPNGTVVVKELLSVGTKVASSGKGYFMGEFTGLEVAVKDMKRFKDEPGNWAYFSFGHEYPLQDEARPQPVANCNACHGGGADDDYVFTQYYPVLRAAKNSAKAK